MKKSSLVWFFILASLLLVKADADCSCSCSSGKKECGNNPIAKRSHQIKQCVYKDMNAAKDSGPITSCQFVKAKNDTALRVTFNGNFRVIGCGNGCCRRWFITINGNECVSPATIDAVVFADGVVNRHIPGILDGFCYNVPKGQVNVGISIGACRSYTNGDGSTGWNSVSRFIIEEVPPM